MNIDQKKAGYEKRQYIRLDADFVLQHAPYSLGVSQATKSVKGSLKNYSSGGVLFESEVPYNIGDLLKLEISIPGWNRFQARFYAENRLSKSEPVVVLALVMRAECLKPDQLFEIGVWFVGVDEGDHWTLTKKIMEKLKKQ